MTSVVLVDDENVLREALSRVLDWEDDIDVVGETGDPHAAAALVRRHRPDVLISDIEMPGKSGLELAAEVLAENPDLPVVLLTRHVKPGLLREALQAGVKGFVGKDASADQIAEVVRTVASGAPFIDSALAAQAMNDDCPLTPREVDVLRVAREGVPVREIGVRLHLATGTVRNYLSDAMGKLDAANRHEAARIAEENDWI